MDQRGKADKLRDMASAHESPHEAAVAREKLLAMGESLDAPRPRRQSAPIPAPAGVRVVVRFGFRADTATTSFHFGRTTNSTGGW